MKKRQKLTIWDLGRVPVSEVKREESVGSLKQYRERLKREEQEAAAAEQRRFESVQNDFNQTLRELNKSQKQLTKELWGRPLDCIDNPASWSGDLAVDPTIGLQDAAKPFDIQADASNLRAVAVEFELNAKELTGYTLNEEGAKRLLYFAFAQAIHGKDLTSVSAWVTCFERLLECDCFDDGEIEFHHAKKATPRPEPVEQPQPEPTYADLEAIDVNTRAGARSAKEVAQALLYSEAKPIFQEWVNHLISRFGYHITESDATYILNELIPASNWSYTDRKTWDKVRLHMCNSGRWDANRLLTADERKAKALEQTNTAAMSPHERRELFRRLGI